MAKIGPVGPQPSNIQPTASEISEQGQPGVPRSPDHQAFINAWRGAAGGTDAKLRLAVETMGDRIANLEKPQEAIITTFEGARGPG